MKPQFDTETFLEISLANPANAEILRRLRKLDLDQCYLTAGCLFQTVWNLRSGLPVTHGINDYDVFYFDEDLTAEAEEAVNAHAQRVFSDLNIKVEVTNQARVHLWYERYFGSRYPRLSSTHAGIDRFLVACTCVG